jgi:hypothetical protein
LNIFICYILISYHIYMFLDIVVLCFKKRVLCIYSMNEFYQCTEVLWHFVIMYLFAYIHVLRQCWNLTHPLYFIWVCVFMIDMPVCVLLSKFNIDLFYICRPLARYGFMEWTINNNNNNNNLFKFLRVRFLRTHGPLIYTCLTIEICFFSGPLDLLIAAHNAVFVFLSIIIVETVRCNIYSLFFLCCPLGLHTSPMRFSARAHRYLIPDTGFIPMCLLWLVYKLYEFTRHTSRHHKKVFFTISEIFEWKHLWCSNYHYNLHHPYALYSQVHTLVF